MGIRIGMISFAHMHANSYAACLQQIPNRVEIAGMFDEDRDRGRAAAETFQAPFFESCDRLLVEEIDGVIICAENAKHEAYTIQAAEAGKHVLCEKPLATTIKSAQAMIDACRENNSQLMTAFPCRYSSPLIRACQLVRERKLGKILAMKGTNHGTMPGGWFIDKELAGGGAVMDHTVHVVDLWRWMLKKKRSPYTPKRGSCFIRISI